MPNQLPFTMREMERGLFVNQGTFASLRVEAGVGFLPKGRKRHDGGGFIIDPPAGLPRAGLKIVG